MDLYTTTELAYKNGYKTGYKDARQWHDMEKPPEKNGKYLVKFKYIESSDYIDYMILNYSNDLFSVDDWDFFDKKGVAGFYTDNHEIEKTMTDSKNFLGWTEIPE